MLALGQRADGGEVMDVDALLNRITRYEEVLRSLADTTPYRITGEALTPTQLRQLIGQIARDAESALEVSHGPV